MKLPRLILKLPGIWHTLLEQAARDADEPDLPTYAVHRLTSHPDTLSTWQRLGRPAMPPVQGKTIDPRPDYQRKEVHAVLVERTFTESLWGAPDDSDDTEYLRSTPLADLLRPTLGPHKALDVLQTPHLYTSAEMKEALLVIEAALCPWPARRVAPWFYYETQAGLSVVNAQWSVYGTEALWPRQASRFLYGAAEKADLARLRRLARRGDLRSYRSPPSAGRELGVYFRHSQVLAYYREHKDELVDKLKR